MVLGAVGAIAVYFFIFLGNCSPIHCRFLVAIFGLASILLAYIAA